MVSGDKGLALNRFIAASAMSQMESHGLANAPSAPNGFAVVHEETPSLFNSWVMDNVVMVFAASEPLDDTLTLSNWYREWAAKHRVADIAARLPSTDILHSAQKMAAGDHFHVTLNTGANTFLDVAPGRKAPKLVSESGKQLIFRCDEPFEGTLQTLVVDRDSLLVSHKPIDISVKK